MRMTPVQAHQMRVNAQQQGEQAATSEKLRAQQWLYHQTALLRGLQSTAAREAHKALVLPEIAPYLTGILDADSGQPDDIVTTCTVWAIDAACHGSGIWTLATNLADYVIRHDLPMPDQFKRNAPTLVADLISDAALAGRIPAPLARNVLSQVLDMTTPADIAARMPDPARAKLHKAIAYALAGKTTKASDPGDWTTCTPGALRQAIKHLTQAETLDEKSGVKKDIQAVQKLLKTEPPDTPAAPENPAPDRKSVV